MDKKFPPRILTSLDLELNTSSWKIIQIGAVTGNLDTGEILERLSIFINPNEQLTPYITQLTKIQQSDVDNGVTLEEGFKQLRDMHMRHGAFHNFLQWGHGDSKCLKDQLQAANPDFNLWCGGRREIDAKTVYVSWRLANNQAPVGGLSRAMRNLGLQFQGQAHDARWDAENTFVIYRKLLELLKKKDLAI